MPTLRRAALRRPTALLAGALLAAAVPAASPTAPRRPVDVRAQFALFDPDYPARIRPLHRRVAALARAVMAAEAAGHASRCAEEVVTELRWRAGSTADYAAIAAEADRLDALLAQPEAEADTQDPADGAWGRCYGEWFFRLDRSYDVLSELGGSPPLLAPRFLDRVAGADALERYLRAVATSNIAAGGINHRREYNLALADLMRLVLMGRPAGYAWDPAAAPRLKALILGPLRDPETGFWGPTYIVDGRPLRVADLSITFHVVKYLGGDVPDWPKIIDTLLAIRDLPYPQGWRHDGGYLAHDLYDVATLFRLGWPRADAAQRTAIGAALGEMQAWCLREIVHPDGRVTVDDDDDSVETATYFAVSLLDELGVFDSRKRFWTDAPPVEAGALAARLRARIAATLARGTTGEGGTYYRAALSRLDGRDP